MRLSSMLIAFGLALIMPAASHAQSWEEYRPDGIGFRIEMPGKPKLETQTTRGGNKAYHAVASMRNMAFVVMYGEPDDKPRDADKLLDAAVKSMTEDKKVLSLKKDMIGGLTARRILVEDADKDNIEARIMIANGRLIQAIFVGPARSAQGRRFLDSLGGRGAVAARSRLSLSFASRHPGCDTPSGSLP